MKRKRVLAALLAALLLPQASMAGRAEAATPLQLNLESHAAFMSGREDGLFHPEDSITRAEAAQIFYTLLTAPPQETAAYPDVDAAAWYSRPVGVLGRLGLLRPDGNGNIRPGDAITRAEFAYLLSACLPSGVQWTTFSDVPASHWAAGAIAAASMFGIFTGYADGSFQPEGLLTRAQAASVMNRLLGRSADLEALEANAGRVSLFPDVPPDSWAFASIMEAAVSHAHAAGPDGRERWTQVEARPTALAEGYHTINGRLYRVKDGVLLRSVTVEGFTFDGAGRYTTGSAALDQRLAGIVAETTNASMTRDQKLRALYNYIRDHYTYLKRPLVDKGETGWEAGYAEDFLQTGRGNCYSYAAAFCLLARQLGLPARAVVGELKIQAVQEHGWVEIPLDGKTYLFDVELEWSCLYKYKQERDLFMVDPDNAHYVYIR